MKVKDLIETLSKMDPEADLYTGTYGKGLDNVYKVQEARIVKNYHCSYQYSDHEDWENIRECEKTPEMALMSQPGVIIR